MVMFGKHANGENKSIEGDLYALGAALGYAVSNVLQEKLSRLEKGYPALTLTAMGVFGSVFSSVFLFCTPMGRRALVLVRKMASSPFKPGNLGLSVSHVSIVFPHSVLLSTLLTRWQFYS